MYIANAIDVVIPSFRLDEQILLRIINLTQPLEIKINFYLIADNPLLTVPDSIATLASDGSIHLVINETNLGFAETRNKGIRLGNSKWLLLLDDDIVPDDGLLMAYATAIGGRPDAIGFAGVTDFPEPLNIATKAMVIQGMTGHFSAARHHQELMWVPTANVMLNRCKMDPKLFDKRLKKGGEDIEFLLRNVQRFNDHYIGVPDAVVEHPWWDHGALQSKRIFRYGGGAAQIASLPVIKPYTFHDFTNTAETLLLLIITAPVAVAFCDVSTLLLICLIVIFSEFITSLLKVFFSTRRWSLAIAWDVLWLKNSYEFGYLLESLGTFRISGFAERIDMGFSRRNPGWFRLNKWKIIKMILILFGLVIINVF